MSIEQMRAVWKFSKQKGSQLLLLLAIADNANEDGVAWPGINYLADKTRMSERQVMRMIPALEAANELAVVYRRGRGNSHLYHVLCNKTAAQIAEIKQQVERLNAAEASTKGDKMSRLLRAKGDKMSGFSNGKGDNLSEIPDKLSQKPDILSQKGDIFDVKHDIVPEKTGDNLLTNNKRTVKEPSRNQTSISPIWGQVLSELRQQMTKATFDAWFFDSQLVAIDGDTAVIEVATQHGADWINNRLTGVVSETLTAVAGRKLTAYARPPLMR